MWSQVVRRLMELPPCQCRSRTARIPSSWSTYNVVGLELYGPNIAIPPFTIAHHSLTVHSTLSYRKAIVRYSTHTMENLGNFTMENLVRYSTLIVQESYSTHTVAHYSAKSRYCEILLPTFCMLQTPAKVEKRCTEILRTYDRPRWPVP